MQLDVWVAHYADKEQPRRLSCQQIGKYMHTEKIAVLAQTLQSIRNGRTLMPQ